MNTYKNQQIKAILQQNQIISTELNKSKVYLYVKYPKKYHLYYLESSSVEVDVEEKKVRPLDPIKYLPARKRCIIILRNVPLDATKNEIFELFLNNSCPVAAIDCEKVLESNHSDCWYVTFNSEDDAQNAFLYLTRETISIRGQKILVKSYLRFLHFLF